MTDLFGRTGRAGGVGWQTGTLVCLVAALGACNGRIGGQTTTTGTGVGTTGAAGGAGAGTGIGGAGGLVTGAAGGISTTPPVCTDTSTPRPGRSPLRRLNLAEYQRTVHDLLGVDTSGISQTFPPDNTGLGFTNNADVLSVTSLLAEAYMTPRRPSRRRRSPACRRSCRATRRRSARTPARSSSSRPSGCAPSGAARGRREHDVLQPYTSGKTGGVFADGIALVIQGMLQSADFLYRVEVTDPAAPLTAVAPVLPTSSRRGCRTSCGARCPTRRCSTRRARVSSRPRSSCRRR